MLGCVVNVMHELLLVLATKSDCFDTLGIWQSDHKWRVVRKELLLELRKKMSPKSAESDQSFLIEQHSL